MTFNFVDLFSGIGGFHAALSELGGECVLAVEKDEEAARVYEDNWKMPALGDVTEIDWQHALGGVRVDVLCAGFPCQPFSKSGEQKGMDEARGTLFFNICEALDVLKPSIVMLENVRNLAGPRHTHEWEVIIRSLRELGYRVSSEPVVLSPNWLAVSDGGAPQNRERVFILGTYVGKEAAMAATDCEPTVKVLGKKQEWSLHLDLPLETHADGPTGLSVEEVRWLRAWEDFSSIFWAGRPRFPLWVDYWGESPIGMPGLPAWKQKIIRSNQEFYLKYIEILELWKTRWNVNSFPASRRKLEWQAGDTEFRDCLVQLRPSGLRVKKANYTGALVAIDQRPIIVDLMRRLTIRECARLQGMPEWFSFDSVSERAAFKQLGNGVNVGVVKYALRTHLAASETVVALGGVFELVEV